LGVTLEQLETFDSHAHLRNALRKIAKERDDWAGFPMPITDHPLIIEPGYPGAAELALIGQRDADPKPAGYRLRNTFWSSHKRSDVIVWNEFEKLYCGLVPGMHHADHDLKTLGISVAWGIEQEAKALALLATHLTHHPFKQYLLTGMFIESSPSQRGLLRLSQVASDHCHLDPK
jgi:hypothetical protein